MNFYTMEQFEIMGDILDEFTADQEWEDFEIDMETHPYDN